MFGHSIQIRTKIVVCLVSSVTILLILMISISFLCPFIHSLLWDHCYYCCCYHRDMECTFVYHGNGKRFVWSNVHEWMEFKALYFQFSYPFPNIYRIDRFMLSASKSGTHAFPFLSSFHSLRSYCFIPFHYSVIHMPKLNQQFIVKIKQHFVFCFSFGPCDFHHDWLFVCLFAYFFFISFYLRADFVFRYIYGLDAVWLDYGIHICIHAMYGYWMHFGSDVVPHQQTSVSIKNTIATVNSDLKNKYNASKSNEINNCQTAQPQNQLILNDSAAAIVAASGSRQHHTHSGLPSNAIPYNNTISSSNNYNPNYNSTGNSNNNSNNYHNNNNSSSNSNANATNTSPNNINNTKRPSSHYSDPYTAYTPLPSTPPSSEHKGIKHFGSIKSEWTWFLCFRGTHTHTNKFTM